MIGLHRVQTMCDWFSWKILNSRLNGPRGSILCLLPTGGAGGRGREDRGCGRGEGGFDILSLISCFSAAWRLTLMHCKDAALTARQHIRVRSALAQESSGLRVIHSEKMKWEWACPPAPRTSRREKREIKAQPVGGRQCEQRRSGGIPFSVDDSNTQRVKQGR